MRLCYKSEVNKQHVRVRPQDSEVVWSRSAAFYCLQQLNPAVRHRQHLHTCSYASLHTHQHNN